MFNKNRKIWRRRIEPAGVEFGKVSRHMNGGRKRSLEDRDEIPNPLLLVLSNALRDPGDVSDFLITLVGGV